MAKMGRPPKPIDWKVVEQLCHIHCTHDEIASFFHLTRPSFYDRVKAEYEEDFPTIYKRYSEGGKCSLRRTQFKMAEKSCAMAIWLGKVYLGQREEIPVLTNAPNQSDINKDHLIMTLQHEIESLKNKLEKNAD